MRGLATRARIRHSSPVENLRVAALEAAHPSLGREPIPDTLSPPCAQPPAQGRVEKKSADSGEKRGPVTRRYEYPVVSEQFREASRRICRASGPDRLGTLGNDHLPVSAR